MNIDELILYLNSNTSEELFGDAGKNHTNYRNWAKLCHPDICSHPRAGECFKLLESKIAENSTKYFKIRSKKLEYELEYRAFASGSVSDLHLSKDGKYIVKIAINKDCNDLLIREKKIINEIMPDRKEKEVLANMFPNIVDSFTIDNRLVNVMEYDDNFVSLSYIRSCDKWKNGVEPATFAWIFKRILSALVVVHDSGYIHGCMTPDHFLVHKSSHAGRMLGFLHSVKHGEVISKLIKNKEFYPKEVLDKLPATKETDIYMVGKLGLFLLGANLKTNELPKESKVHEYLFNFLKSMVIENQKRRQDSAMILYIDFDKILSKVFGKPKYHQLTGV